MAEPTSAPQDDDDDDDDEQSPIMTILIGLGLLAFAGFLFWMFSGLEAEGGRKRIPAILALLYNIGGKWLPTVLIGGIGLLTAGLGVKGALTKR
jgi:hypothetical protein